MEEFERDMELIAIISGEISKNYSFVDTDKEHIEHFCKGLNQQVSFDLRDVEFFKEGKIKTAKANFCEHCKQVFIYKSNK